MAKVVLTGQTMLGPVPAALVSCGTVEKPNVLTVAWTGIINSIPPRTYVSVTPQRFTHDIIAASGEFCINLPSASQVREVDICGTRSGRDTNKFELLGLTAEKCETISAPRIAQCPISLECRVFEVKNLGSHDMFLADILAVAVDEGTLDEKNHPDPERAGLLAFSHRKYYSLGGYLGNLGYTVKEGAR